MKMHPTSVRFVGLFRNSVHDTSTVVLYVNV